ncbi:hypothetical protein E2C01_075566 [Portunus trituberculatus]|uniref:Uncharacterized protein n=1 Tax=Portunus trituberculatus TaxID=210409 RepID=A0A5B7IHD8_PORTR|nr:hypothetical protein [Portunus trituberculatus]
MFSTQHIRSTPPYIPATTTTTTQGRTKPSKTSDAQAFLSDPLHLLVFERCVDSSLLSQSSANFSIRLARIRL